MRAFSAEPSGGGSSSPASRSSRSSAAAAEKAAPGQSAAGSSSKERLRRYEITRITRPTGNQPAPVVVCCITSKVSTALLQPRSEEHTSELQSRGHLVCRLLLE